MLLLAKLDAEKKNMLDIATSSSASASMRMHMDGLSVAVDERWFSCVGYSVERVCSESLQDFVLEFEFSKMSGSRNSLLLLLPAAMKTAHTLGSASWIAVAS